MRERPPAETEAAVRRSTTRPTVAASSALGWLADQYTIAGFRVTRRWYGTRAHVCRRGREDDEAPARFIVLCRDTENMPVPWLKVCQLDENHITKWAEDATPFWAPVTDFAPYTVRKFRPGVLRFGRVAVPWFSWWRPLRQPSGFLDGAR
jgi:hypothetical protein